jgi:hypothetical protein
MCIFISVFFISKVRNSIAHNNTEYAPISESSHICHSITYTVTIETDDPLQFVLDLNLHRRHLNETQRAMVAASIANMPLGGAGYRSANLQTDPGQAVNLPLEVSVAEAAKKLNVSERTVKTAKQVKEKGSPELVAAVESGKVAVSDAVVVVDLTTDADIIYFPFAIPMVEYFVPLVKTQIRLGVCIALFSQSTSGFKIRGLSPCYWEQEEY